MSLKEKRGDEEEETQRTALSAYTTGSLIDPHWEIADPNPDIHTLFNVFNIRFFWRALDAVLVKWSPRMTSCAGICTFKGRRGGCFISLSLPLLKLRPRKDLVETLLHEMIHAYLFLTNNNKDRDGHGPEFRKHMKRINQEAGTRITIYHSFHDEVKVYQTHWWRCEGPCKDRPPFFGYVKRAMNRAPGPNDYWFPAHQETCGGVFIKVKEPQGFKAKPSKAKKEPLSVMTNYFPRVNVLKEGGSGSCDLDAVSPVASGSGGANKTFVPFEGKGHVASGGANKTFVPFEGKGHVASGGANKTFVRFENKGHVVGGSGALNMSQSGSPVDCPRPHSQPTLIVLSDSDEDDPPQDLVNCPVCFQSLKLSLINSHLDMCVSSS